MKKYLKPELIFITACLVSVSIVSGEQLPPCCWGHTDTLTAKPTAEVTPTLTPDAGDCGTSCTRSGYYFGGYDGSDSISYSMSAWASSFCDSGINDFSSECQFGNAWVKAKIECTPYVEGENSIPAQQFSAECVRRFMWHLEGDVNNGDSSTQGYGKNQADGDIKITTTNTAKDMDAKCEVKGAKTEDDDDWDSLVPKLKLDWKVTIPPTLPTVSLSWSPEPADADDNTWKSDEDEQQESYAETLSCVEGSTRYPSVFAKATISGFAKAQGDDNVYKSWATFQVKVDDLELVLE